MTPEDLSGLLTPQNALLAGSILPIVEALRRIVPGFFQTTVGQRLLPVLPLLVGVGAVFCGLGSAGPDMLNKIIVGVIAGAVAGHSYKTMKTSAMGSGVTAPETKREEVKE